LLDFERDLSRTGRLPQLSKHLEDSLNSGPPLLVQDRVIAKQKQSTAAITTKGQSCPFEPFFRFILHRCSILVVVDPHDYFSSSAQPRDSVGNVNNDNAKTKHDDDNVRSIVEDKASTTCPSVDGTVTSTTMAMVLQRSMGTTTRQEQCQRHGLRPERSDRPALGGGGTI
jgi:hypothetical protein